MTVAYFIRRTGDTCSVIKLYPGNREEVVQDDLSPIEAEILCEMRMADIPRPVVQQELTEELPLPKHCKPKRRDARPRQLTFKF